MHESHYWTVAADTCVISIQRFVPVGFDGARTVWNKDRCAIECPYNVKIGDNLYALVGAVGHIGQSMHGGHYIAMVRNVVDKQWYTCNDGRVTKYKTKSPETTSFVRMNEGADPCILFYQKHVLLDDVRPSDGYAVIHDVLNPDSPETKCVHKFMNTTPKRPQSFQPSACKKCGDKACAGTCLQCL